MRGSKHILLVSLFAICVSALLDAATMEGRVSKVSDGDTVWVNVELENGVRVGERREKVRLAKIDAPEKKQPYGKESAEYLSNRVFGKVVQIVYEKADRYGRILGTMFLGGKDVNLEMIATGNAWHYAYFDKTPSYANAERAAREARLGLWAASDPVDPQSWRKQTRSVMAE